MKMKNYKYLFIAGCILLFSSCKNEFKSDASGVFEADEVIVSAQQTGQLLYFQVNEGNRLTKDSVVGQIDVTTDQLRAAQIEASIKALKEKTDNPRNQVEFIRKQLIVQQSQLAQQEREKIRTENLLKSDAATQKQLDDINALIDQLQKQIAATQQQMQLSLSNINTQNRSIMSDQTPLVKSVDEVKDQIRKGIIICPITGTVLTKYAYEGEMTAVGKALFKIADVDTITLRAYISGDQLAQVKLGQIVKVLVDSNQNSYKEYPGTISWISSQAEFTPKTIQTKDERANLVYAIKIRVKNDGYLKIGMYGEVRFN